MNVWYLVGAHDGKFRTYRLSRITHINQTARTFQRDPAFNLMEYWQANARAFITGLPHYPVRIAVEADRKSWVSNFLSLEAHEFIVSDDIEWLETTINFDTQEQAIMGLIGVVPHIRILEPLDLRQVLLDYARQAVTCLTSKAEKD